MKRHPLRDNGVWDSGTGIWEFGDIFERGENRSEQRYSGKPDGFAGTPKRKELRV